MNTENNFIKLEQLEDEQMLALVNQEFRDGFEFVRKYRHSVTLWGSARLKPDTVYYQQAESLAQKIVTNLDYAIVTGGGPGIMEAGNKGAFEAGGNSVGITIKLPHEQHTNQFVSAELSFEHFFARKTMMAFGSEAYVFFPGGFGTMDEFFEILTLVQTKKIKAVPIVLFGVDFWTPLMQCIKEQMLENNQTISPEDLNLFIITDDENKVINIIKNAPIIK